MAGKWDKSGNQVIGLNGRPEVGARAYFFVAATSTPLTTYTDYSLAVTNPAYVETDSYGRWPSVYFDDSDNSFFRERATNAGGSVVYFDNSAVPIVGPGDGESDPAAPVDPNALLETGDIKVSYDTGTKAGFVRANARTIGNAASGAAERANADTQDLFEHLWNKDSALAVSGGRGASATADFEANKTISLPDFRGRSLAALDDMGNAAAGVLTGLTTLGETAGSQSVTLTAGQIPQLSGTTSSNGAHTHSVGLKTRTADGGNGPYVEGAGSDVTVTTSSNGAHTHTITVGASSPTSVSTVPPLIGVTVYLKL